MRKVFLLLFCLSAFFCFGQSGNKKPEERLTHKPIFNDSSLLRLKRLDDSIAKAAVLKDIDNSFERNNNYLLEIQKERRAREKKGAIIRIAIGIGFLIILIFGLRRRVKK